MFSRKFLAEVFLKLYSLLLHQGVDSVELAPEFAPPQLGPKEMYENALHDLTEVKQC